MDGRPPVEKRRTLAALMAAVAILAVACSLLRPYATPAASRAANRVLAENGPRSGIDPARFAPVSAVKTPSGSWQVRYAPVEGSGNRERVVTVPDQVVQRARFLPW